MWLLTVILLVVKIIIVVILFEILATEYCHFLVGMNFSNLLDCFATLIYYIGAVADLGNFS